MTTLRAALLAMLSCIAPALHAHDSWFAREGDAAALVTGTRFPRAELVPAPESFAQRQCAREGPVHACWAELREFDIALDAKIVDVYFREARPGDAVRAQWKALHAQGQAWRERYRKFARIEWSDGAESREERRALRRPAHLDLELLPVGDAALDAGTAARFVLLSNGSPLADQPVELVSDRNPLGSWARTDAAGQVSWTIPFPAAWLVRTIVIEPDGPDRFRSRFATFAFEAH